MKHIVALLSCLFIAAISLAVPLPSNARTSIPSEVQQIICVDYMALRNSSFGMALKGRVLPDNLKQFEVALNGMSINPDRDVQSLVFVLFRSDRYLRGVGFASGEFQFAKFAARQKAQKVKPERYRDAFVYPAGKGDMVVTFLDETTMLFGDTQSVHYALDARDGEIPALSSNSEICNLINSAHDGTIWSVLDKVGTQNILRSALGDAAKFTDFDFVQQRLTGSYYSVDFTSGVDLNLTVALSDPMVAATLSSFLKAGLMLKKMGASPTQKTAIESTTVDNSDGNLLMHFKVDDTKFQSLIESDIFAIISK